MKKKKKKKKKKNHYFSFSITVSDLPKLLPTSNLHVKELFKIVADNILKLISFLFSQENNVDFTCKIVCLVDEPCRPKQIPHLRKHGRSR